MPGSSDRSKAAIALAIASISIAVPGNAAPNFATYSGIARIRSSMISTLTGVSVSRIDIEPVATDDFAWASSVAFRPSQPNGPSACPMLIRGCDLRDVSLPESLRLFISVVPQPRYGKWQLAHAVLPDAEIRGSQKRLRPNSTSGLFSVGFGGGRLYSVFMAPSLRAEGIPSCA